MKLLHQCLIIHCVLTGFWVFGGIILKCEDQIGTQGNPVTLRCTADYSETGTPCPLQSYKWKKNSTAIFEFKCGDAYSKNKPGYVCDSTVKEITDSLPILTNGIYTLWIQTECDWLESQPFRVTFKAPKISSINCTDKDCTNEKSDGSENYSSTPKIIDKNGYIKKHQDEKNYGAESDLSNTIVGVVCSIILCISICALGLFMAIRYNSTRRSSVENKQPLGDRQLLDHVYDTQIHRSHSRLFDF